MKLASLTLQNVLGAPDGTFALSRPGGAPAPVILFRGSNASGKTSVLRAIAALKEQVGAYGSPPRPSSLRRRGTSDGRIAGTWVLNAEEQRYAGLDDKPIETELLLNDEVVQPLTDPGLQRLMSSGQTPERVGRFELVPAERAFVDGAPALPPAMEVAHRARDVPSKYAGMAAWLVERSLADAARAIREVDARGLVTSWDRPDSLRSIRVALGQLLPHLRLRGVEPSDVGHRVVFEREDGATFDLHELSTTERDLVLLCLVVHRQRLDHSLVLVDEPVRGVASDRSAGLLRALAGLAADMQLMVASSATDLSAAVPLQIDIDLDREAARVR